MHCHLAIILQYYYTVLLAQSGCASYLESCRLVYEVYFLTIMSYARIFYLHSTITSTGISINTFQGTYRVK